MRDQVRKHRRARALGLESLEARQLLSAVELSGGTLSIEGTPRNDRVLVSVANNQIHVKLNGEEYQYDLADVSNIRVHTYGGRDRVVLKPNVPVPATIFGGPGPDKLLGGAGSDILYGGRGRDELRGRGGNDELHGGLHSDRLYGGRGEDHLYGGPGRDLFRGGRHKDELYADRVDAIFGTRGDAILSSQGSHRKIEYQAWLTGAGNESAKVEYQEKLEHGTWVQEFDVHIWNAEPNTTYDIMVDGQQVGSVTTDASGSGKLELHSNPHETHHLPLPANFPEIGPGTQVSVDGMQGTLVADHGSWSSAGDPAGGQGQGTKVEYKTWLTGDGAGSGKAEYKREPKRWGTETEFELEIWNQAPNTSYDIVVDGVTVGQITTDQSGHGKVEFKNRPGGSHYLPFPANFPEVGAGTVVQVDGLQGTLSMTFSGDRSDGERPHHGDNDRKQQVEYKARLSGAGAGWGEAKYEREWKQGMLKVEFEVELYNATPNTTYEVSVGGVVVGQVTTDAFGRGKIEFTNRPRKPHHQPFPADFPQIEAGTPVEVGGLQGSLQLHYS